MTQKVRYLVLTGLAVGLLAVLYVSIPGQDPASEAAKPKKKVGAWAPVSIDKADYRDIVDFNIFNADRAGLKRQHEARTNPKPKPPVVAKPKDPGPPPLSEADFVLIGVTLYGEQRLAFIEKQRDDKEITRLEVPDDFFNGRIVSIDATSAIYLIDGEERRVGVGANLQGELVALPPKTESRSSRSSSNDDDRRRSDEVDDRPERPSSDDRERFRQRRQRD